MCTCLPMEVLAAFLPAAASVHRHTCHYMHKNGLHGNMCVHVHSHTTYIADNAHALHVCICLLVHTCLHIHAPVYMLFFYVCGHTYLHTCANPKTTHTHVLTAQPVPGATRTLPWQEPVSSQTWDRLGRGGEQGPDTVSSMAVSCRSCRAARQMMMWPCASSRTRRPSRSIWSSWWAECRPSRWWSARLCRSSTRCPCLPASAGPVSKIIFPNPAQPPTTCQSPHSLPWSWGPGLGSSSHLSVIGCHWWGVGGEAHPERRVSVPALGDVGHRALPSCPEPHSAVPTEILGRGAVSH